MARAPSLEFHILYDIDISNLLFKRTGRQRNKTNTAFAREGKKTNKKKNENSLKNKLDLL